MVLTLVSLAGPEAWAQPQALTQAQRDSGWVPFFNGENFDGFYLYTHDPAVDPEASLNANPDPKDSTRALSVRDGMIYARGTPNGYLATKKSYSHYRLRLRMKYVRTGTLVQNSGLLYDVDEKSSYRTGGGWPQCYEFQGKNTEMGALIALGISQSSTADPAFHGTRYREGGKPMTCGYCLPDSVRYVDGAWNTLELTLRGADSVIQQVNGAIVYRGWKLRGNDGPVAGGSIALQSENAPNMFRDLMIMELDPATGRPLNGKPTVANALPPRPQRRAPFLRGSGATLYIVPVAAGDEGDGRARGPWDLAGRVPRDAWLGNGN